MSADIKCSICIYFFVVAKRLHTLFKTRFRRNEEGSNKDTKKANVYQCKHACDCQWISL